MTRHAGFSGMDQDRFERTRSFGDPQGLGLGVDTLPGVGPAVAKRLRALGIATVGDVLLHVPRRYEQAADEVAIAQLWGDDEVAIGGVVRDVRSRRLGGRRTIVTAKVEDATGSISASWFNQPWLVDRLKPGTHVRLRGKLGRHGFDVKSYDVGEARATADFAPVYPASEEVPSTRLRELVRGALAGHARDVLDPLPADLGLPVRRDALAVVHFPETLEQAADEVAI
ncbi:MAG TPA: OB-fold nucleic acid binding domain-containing protein, partial [Gaiellaceae bacterium]